LSATALLLCIRICRKGGGGERAGWNGRDTRRRRTAAIAAAENWWRRRRRWSRATLACVHGCEPLSAGSRRRRGVRTFLSGVLINRRGAVRCAGGASCAVSCVRVRRSAVRGISSGGSPFFFYFFFFPLSSDGTYASPRDHQCDPNANNDSGDDVSRRADAPPVEFYVYTKSKTIGVENLFERTVRTTVAPVPGLRFGFNLFFLMFSKNNSFWN